MDVSDDDMHCSRITISSFNVAALAVLFCTGIAGFAEQPVYMAGYRHYKWHDETRQRAVWVDVWYPAKEGSKEQTISYGLGGGSVAYNDKLSPRGAPFPVVVLSHGAFGSARGYGWIAEYLARNGVIVLGVSHFGESWLYGSETVDRSAVLRLWVRPIDCTFALDQLVQHEDFREYVDTSRIGAVGHSSGGNTAIVLAGAVFDPAAMGSYCTSDAARGDRGCQYARELEEMPPMPPEASASYRDSRVRAVVAMDPAVGPGYSAESLARVSIPVLVIGSEDNDFLPFEHHAGRYAGLMPHASLIKLSRGEGHFVYLNVCTSSMTANGVPLCTDREGVNREDVHAELAPRILEFLAGALN